MKADQILLQKENFEELMGVEFSDVLPEGLGEPEELTVYDWDGGEYHGKVE